MINKQCIQFLIGLPASGKTTFAKEWISMEPCRRVRVNKDDLREMLHNGHYSRGNEKQIIRLEESIILYSLKQGKDVVLDNTHLGTDKKGRNKHLERIKRLLKENKLDVEIKIHDFNFITPEECIRRDLKREKSVGASTIWDMYWKHIANIPEVFYDENKKDAIIVDIDGTLAKMGKRGPYDWDKVHLDTVNSHIKKIANLYHQDGYDVICLSGRDLCCYDLTKKWLEDNGIKYTVLFMRGRKDNRKDFIVKEELYTEYIKPYYNINMVIDDRPQVIRQWVQLGLQVISANPLNIKF